MIHPDHQEEDAASAYDEVFRLGGYRAANSATDEAFWQHIGINGDCLRTLASYHRDGGSSYFVLHDSSATWEPGAPQLIALHLMRDTRTRTFRFEHLKPALVALAQTWLIHRGCPKDAIRLPPDVGTTPADPLTHALEEHLLDTGAQHTLLGHHTNDLGVPDLPSLTTVLLRAPDTDPDTTARPFRVFVEEADLRAHTHTLREAAFPTYREVLNWLESQESLGPASWLPRSPPRTPRPVGGTGRTTTRPPTGAPPPPGPPAPPRRTGNQP
ncbi:hypothetical protein OK074_5033 [Actinobacteria bacterium OK074]|nr:hypothetical protein OK074_5033 [Actinobacteria bacterium OK074]